MSDRTTCLSTKCRKRARFFGRWAGGGFCLIHAGQYAADYGMDEFHAADREALQKEKDSTIDARKEVAYAE